MIPPVSAKMVRCFLAALEAERLAGAGHYLRGPARITVHRASDGIKLGGFKLENDYIAQPNLFWETAVSLIAHILSDEMAGTVAKTSPWPILPPIDVAASFRRFCAGPVPMQDIEAAALHAEFLITARIIPEK